VAHSCPQCGAAVAPGMRSCQFCGAQVELEEPAPEQSAPAETPFQEAAPESLIEKAAPEPAAREGAPSALPAPLTASPSAQEDARTEQRPVKPAPVKPQADKRMLSCVVPAAVGLVAVGLLLFMGYRVLSFVGSGSSPSGSAAHTFGAGAPAGGTTATDLGVDIYPGARPLSDEERRDSTDGAVVSQSFVTPARMDLVIDFYKARMVGQTSIYASGNGVVVSINPSAQESILVAIAPAPSGETRIAITRSTATGSH